MDFSAAEITIDFITFGIRRFSGNDGRIKTLCKIRKLFKILTYYKNFILRITVYNFLSNFKFPWIFACNPVLYARPGNCVVNLLFFRQIKANFNTFCRCNPSGMFKFLPGNVIPFRAYKTEHVAFTTVFAYKSSSKSHAPYCLKLRYNTENRRRKHMHFIVDNKSPRTFAENRKMRIRSVFFRSPGKNLVSCNSNLFYSFIFAGIFGNLFFRKVCFIKQFLNPLVDGRNICSDDKRTCFQQVHYLHSYNRFSCTARKDNRSKSCSRSFISDKSRRRRILIFAYFKRFSSGSYAPQLKIKRFAVLQLDFIFYRPQRLKKKLLNCSTVSKFKGEAVIFFFARKFRLY